MEHQKWRQMLHIEPPEGWLNDPNGLCFFQGEYHVYFQYSPDSAEGASPRCWGHYHGDSLICPEFDKIVLLPDSPEDKDGVYSGSAFEYDGHLQIFYTGNAKEEGEYDYVNSGRDSNVIRVTSVDGSKMSEKQVVLRNADYPDFCSCHVRDPKLWQEEDEWNMVLGARTIDGEGCVLVYRSKDLEHWEYTAKIFIPDFGYMWECPDYFKIHGKGFLSVSPQGLASEDKKYQNVYQSGYFRVEGSLVQNKLYDFTEWDMGFDFYAPQTFETPDGRRILIGWMGIGDIPYSNPTVSLGWQHCLTLPREITMNEDGLLLQNPIREITALRKEEQRIADQSTQCLSMPFDLYGETTGDFWICLDQKLKLEYHAADAVFTMNFMDDNYGGGRTIRKAEVGMCKSIRVIADMSSIEIYLNDGERVMSSRFYPDGESVLLALDGMEAAVWNLF